MFLVLSVLVSLAHLHVCQAVYDDEPPAPEGVPYNNYSRIYSFLSSRRRGQTSNRVRKGYIVSNVTFTVLSISAVESNPSYLKTEIMIEEEWRLDWMAWTASDYGNLSEISRGWALVVASMTWFPILSYEQETWNQNRDTRKSYSLNCSGHFRISSASHMMFYCVTDSDGMKHCYVPVRCYAQNARTITLPWWTAAFGKVELRVHPGFAEHTYKVLNTSVSRGPGPRKVEGETIDESILHLTLQENDILASSEATWPMFCIATSMIALCWREGTSYELFSLRTGLTIFCAIACMLGVDQRIHPRVGDRPYLSWIVGFHVVMSGLVLVEKLYLALRDRFGHPEIKGISFPGYVGRFLTASAVLVAFIII